MPPPTLQCEAPTALCAATASIELRPAMRSFSDSESSQKRIRWWRQASNVERAFSIRSFSDCNHHEDNLRLWFRSHCNIVVRCREMLVVHWASLLLVAQGRQTFGAMSKVEAQLRWELRSAPYLHGRNAGWATSVLVFTPC